MYLTGTPTLACSCSATLVKRSMRRLSSWSGMAVKTKVFSCARAAPENRAPMKATAHQSLIIFPSPKPSLQLSGRLPNDAITIARGPSLPRDEAYPVCDPKERNTCQRNRPESLVLFEICGEAVE